MFCTLSSFHIALFPVRQLHTIFAEIFVLLVAFIDWITGAINGQFHRIVSWINCNLNYFQTYARCADLTCNKAALLTGQIYLTVSSKKHIPCNAFPNPLPSSYTLIRTADPPASGAPCQKSRPVPFPHTPWFSLFVLLCQDVHQHLLFDKKVKSHYRIFHLFIYWPHPDKGLNISGKATMVQYHLPKVCSNPY